MDRTNRIAFLVDAENVNVEQTRFALEDAQARGLVTVRRAFGDFFRPHLAGWKPFLVAEAFTVELTLSAIARKDVADLMLGQYAVRVAERGHADMVALVSSDSDFGAIARSVSEAGLPVIGYGRAGVPESWVRSCAAFVAFPEKPAAPAVGDDAEKLKSTILNLMRDGVDEDGWLRLSTLGTRLTAKLGKGYARRLGAGTLTKLIERFPKEIEVERRDDRGAAPALYIRRRRR
jgi:uncharacterized LabA/DUF88 family protein